MTPKRRSFLSALFLTCFCTWDEQELIAILPHPLPRNVLGVTPLPWGTSSPLYPPFYPFFVGLRRPRPGTHDPLPTTIRKTDLNLHKNPKWPLRNLVRSMIEKRELRDRADLDTTFASLKRRLPQPQIKSTRRIHLEIRFNPAFCLIRSSIFYLKSIFGQTLLILLHFFIIFG